MKKIILFAAAAAVLMLGFLGCGESPSPAEKTGPQKTTVEAKPVKHYSIEQFMDVVSFMDCGFSFDEKSIFFSSDRSGIYNIYSVSIENAESKPLTHSEKESYFLVSGFPGDNRVLFTADSGGNEIDHIYLREEDGTIRDLTPEPQARASFLDWSNDYKSFFYLSNKRDPKYMDIYEMDIASFKSLLFYQNDRGFNEFTISGNKRYVACQKIYTSHNADIFLYDREKGETRNITVHEGDIQNLPQTFDVESKKLYFLSDENSEFQYVKAYDPGTGQTEKVVEKAWDINEIFFTRQGTYRVISINNDGRIEVEIFDTRKQEMAAFPEFPANNVRKVRFSPNENRIAFYLSGSDSPSDLYMYDIKMGVYKKLTDSMNPEIAKEDLVKAKVIRYKSFDGLEIPSIFYVPHGLQEGERIPALVWVHGGPGGQSSLRYSDLLQYLVNHGYAVLAVNNRGSSGYGKTFFKRDDLKHGEDDLQDCIEAKAFLNAAGFVDESKIGIIGGSYGGYMVLAALAFKPQEFNVGVNLFGVANWLRTLKSIPSWWEAERESLYKEMGNPNTDEEYLKRISPLFHAGNIAKPLIVLQGANDPRVLKVESDEIVAAVKKKGVPVEYVVFADEGHGFYKRKNQIQAYKAILEFLDKYLKGKKENYIY